MNGYQIAACVLRHTVQRQVTAEGHVDAFHAAVGIVFRSVCSVRDNIDLALAALQTDFGLMIQLFPICGRGFSVFFNQCPINRHGAVLVAGSTADTGAGHAVIILLPNNSGFKAALDLYMKLIGIPAFGVGRNGCASSLVDDQLKGQIFVAGCRDGDKITAFQRWDSAIAVSREQQLSVINFILTASHEKRGGLPCCSVHGNAGNFICVIRFAEGYLPVIPVEARCKADLAQIDGAVLRCAGLLTLTAGAAGGILHNGGSILIAALFQIDGQIFIIIGRNDTLGRFRILGQVYLQDINMSGSIGVAVLAGKILFARGWI